MALNDILFAFVIKNKLRGKDRLYKLFGNCNELLVLLIEADLKHIMPLVGKESTHHDLSNFTAMRS